MNENSGQEHGTDKGEGKRHHSSSSPLRRIGVLLALGSVLIAATYWAKESREGFYLTHARVPIKDIVSGGPGKDGIPAILDPKFVSAETASFLRDEDRVLGLAIGAEAKAYPVKILNWHEIVNDSLARRSVVVTYCPLCGTGIAFEAQVGERLLSFGVSGLLYQSDLLMYDHQTESLWSQVGMEAVTGPLAGARLTPLILRHTTWQDWRARHPTTFVLSTDTGYTRDYDRDPYGEYATVRDLMFDVAPFDPIYDTKAWVVGVMVEKQAKAYAFSELKQSPAVVRDRINEKIVQVHFDRETRTAWITDEEGTTLPSVIAFWFAWYAFHPDTEVFHAPQAP